MRERGTIIKQRQRNLHTGLLYPDTYEIAMSSLAYQRLYFVLNNSEGVLCDRFVSNRAKSLEHNLSPRDIKIAFITVPFILCTNYVVSYCHYYLNPHNVLTCIGGAGVTANPKLFKHCKALVFTGSIEENLENIRTIMRMVKAGVPNEVIINEMQPILDGIPIGYENNGILEYDPPCSVIYTSETEFSNMHLIEISRGCRGSCNFCMSRHLYGHYREFEYERIIKAVDAAPDYIKSIGLIGDAVLSHSRIKDIVNYILHKKKRPAFASIRIADLNDDKIPLILKSRVKTITIAPEVASEKLMRVTNKYYNRDALFCSLKELIKNGVVNIKLYMMIGLPNESREDIFELIDFIRELRGLLVDLSKKKGRLGILKVTINNFVPSPFTPLFSCNPDEIKNLEYKQTLIKTELSNLSNLTISMMDIFDTLYQTALFRANDDYARKILLTDLNLVKRAFREDTDFANDILKLCYS
ncbi:MAG: radical SAM protein [Deltaproteobacteria bacterium]|nr:radical SAM protein [Deltaproteobacteria bacterium]